MPIIGRRGLILGLVTLVAAPAIVRASSLMEIRGVPLVANLDYVALAFQEFTVRGWDQFGITIDEVMAGTWQKYYGQDAELLNGKEIAKWPSHGSKADFSTIGSG